MPYKVTNHGTIIHRTPAGGRVRLTPGMIVPDGMFDETQIQEHTHSGYLVHHLMPEIEQKDFRPDPALVVGGPERAIDKADPITVSTKPAAEPAETVGVSHEGIQTSGAPAQGAPAMPPKKFDFTAKSLKGKTLEQLNTLIVTTDPSVKPQETVKAAI